MHLAAALVLSLAPLIARPALAQTAPSAIRVADLAWMAGSWASESKGELSEEVWTAPEGDSMNGTWRWVLDGKVKLFEFLAIVAEDDGLVFLLRHFDRNGVGWEEKSKPLRLRPVSLRGHEVVFEGPGSKGRLRITYRREGEVLACSVERGGTKEEFRMKRR